MKIKILNWWKPYNSNVTVLRLSYGAGAFCFTVLNFSLYIEK